MHLILQHYFLKCEDALNVRNTLIEIFISSDIILEKLLLRNICWFIMSNPLWILIIWKFPMCIEDIPLWNISYILLDAYIVQKMGHLRNCHFNDLLVVQMTRDTNELLHQKHFPSTCCQGMKDGVLMKRDLKWALREDMTMSRKKDSSILPTPSGIV